MSPRRVLPKPVEEKPPKPSRKRSPKFCPEPTPEQERAAEQIVAGVPPAAALAAIGVTSPPSMILKGGAMRTALRTAIEKELRSRDVKGGIDGIASKTLVDGLAAMRPVVAGREVIAVEDHPTRGAFLDRLFKLTGDFGKSTETEEGGAWDSLVLRMRRSQPVLGE